MRRWAWAVTLVVMLAACRKEQDPQSFPSQGPSADSPEWSLQKLVEALDSLEWKGDWVPAMLPSAFREGPAIAGSLTYRWRERELVLEFLAYERYESLKSLPAEEACRKIALCAREEFSKEPLRTILAKTLEALPGPPSSPEDGLGAGRTPEERSCLTVIQVTVEASEGDQPPYREVSTCREILPVASPASNERTVHSVPERSPTS